TRLRICRLARTDHRVLLGPPLLHRPREESGEMPARCGRSAGAVSAGDGGEPGGDVGVLNLADPARVQETKIGTGEVQLHDLIGGRPHLTALAREVDLDHLAESTLGRSALRCLRVLWI